ncbi:type II secretion system F family protein [Halopseudomonas yangmingensis]|uniref:Tight adherence protein C n=1 Tax=Halopseudomonas yangmingensis TaxID=1720063 RepID=A0A1I4ULY1_9GAMM|nr:type II secretion system F family protein [Halopseudomonas yangmingensis]SFM89921.1 tight adherence protein C [Halopseudomonas yangmingensis]
MSDQILPLLIAGISVCAAIMLVVSLSSLFRGIPETDRRYMDPLPRFLKLIWPLADFIAVHVGERLPVELLEKIRAALSRSGLSYLMSPEQFFGLQIISAAFFFSLAYFGLSSIEVESVFLLISMTLLGFFFPYLSVSDRKKVREKDIVRSLSIYLDFITMAVEAGLNLNGALIQAVDKGPDGPLKVELHRVLRDIKAGMSRADALRLLADRLQIREINALVSSLIQSEKTGSSVGMTLRIQAEQRRVERFQRAEKLALEAPVKLIFPLVAFIFPTTFIILGFPILMKFMYEL